MVTTKKTSFPSLHSDQGHGLTKVWSKRNKSQNYKRKKEGLNASKSLGERRWEEGGLLEEGFNSQSVDISPKIIFTPKYVRFVINCCESHLRTFCRQIHQSAKIGGRGVEPILAMPGFWELLLQPPLPYCSSCDSFTLALCAFDIHKLRICSADVAAAAAGLHKIMQLQDSK